MAFRSASSNHGGSATPTVSVPAGVQADDIVFLWASGDQSGWTFDTADYPTGFTELHEGDITNDGQGWAIGWKRLTGADAGSYTFGSVGASDDWVCAAVAFSGRHTTDSPVSGGVTTSNAANTTPVTATATGVTASTGDDLLYVCIHDVAGAALNYSDTTGIPSGMTECVDIERTPNGWASTFAAYQDNVSAGATGNKSSTFTLAGGSSGYATFLIRIPASGGGGGTPAPDLLGITGVGT